MSRSQLLADGSGVAIDSGVDCDREEELQKSKPSVADICVGWCARALMATVWISSLVFALDILVQYLIAIPHHLERWGHMSAGQPAATIGIGIHFAAGALILILGGIQLIRPLRTKWP